MIRHHNSQITTDEHKSVNRRCFIIPTLNFNSNLPYKGLQRIFMGYLPLNINIKSFITPQDTRVAKYLVELSQNASQSSLLYYNKTETP